MCDKITWLVNQRKQKQKYSLMAQFGLRPSGIRSRFLQINSSHDVHVESLLHNPADFEVSMPNSAGCVNVWRVVPQTVSIPRAFPNIYAPSNKLILYRRRIVITDLGLNMWTVLPSPSWEAIPIEVPRGRYTGQRLVDFFNSHSAFGGFTWAWDTTEEKVTVMGPSGLEMPSYMFGNKDQPENPPTSPYEFMPQCYLAEGEGSHIFDVLGFTVNKFVAGGNRFISSTFDPYNLNTADCITGSAMENAVSIVPLFDTSVHSYDAWCEPILVDGANPANLVGPVCVNVMIKELGDGSTIDTESGKPLDVVAVVPVSSVLPFNYATYTAQDCDAEAIQFRQTRTVRSFNVQLQDQDGTVLWLPRNWPVFLRLQILQSD